MLNSRTKREEENNRNELRRTYNSLTATVVDCPQSR